MRYSARTDWDLRENAYARAIRSARQQNKHLIDLTQSNPSACGFEFDVNSLLQPLIANGAAKYQPEPLGMLSARESVAAYYRDSHFAGVDPTRVCLTTSTSEAYSFLFRLLCNPGDEVLIARPSYPLFDFIARLDDVQLREYPLFPHDGWHIDLHALESAITPRTKAIIIVHPNNPTGNYASRMERLSLDALCAGRGIVLIVDEVFLDYNFAGEAQPTFATGEGQALTFVLSGISKVCALPQMKLSWLIACGPEAEVARAMERVEVIADTFLSVNAPVQHALPCWMRGRHALQRQIKERAAANLRLLDARIHGSLANRLDLQGGWTTVLRVPRHVAGTPFVFAALANGVIVQPGELYGLGGDYVVLSLLTPAEAWELGIARLLIE